jgi:hypothetical protein
MPICFVLLINFDVTMTVFKGKNEDFKKIKSFFLSSLRKCKDDDFSLSFNYHRMAKLL